MRHHNGSLFFPAAILKRVSQHNNVSPTSVASSATSVKFFDSPPFSPVLLSTTRSRGVVIVINVNPDAAGEYRIRGPRGGENENKKGYAVIARKIGWGRGRRILLEGYNRPTGKRLKTYFQNSENTENLGS